MQKIAVGSAEYSLDTENDCAVSFSCISDHDGVTVLRLKLTFDGYTVPKPCTVRFHERMIGYCGMWHPMTRFARNLGPNWAKRGPNSRTASNAPVLSVFGYREENKVTVCLSDVRNASEVVCGVREENGEMDFSIRLLTQALEPIEEYETDIRIDRSEIGLFEAVSEVRAYWEALGFRNANVPPAVYEPVYSTWYNFHQDLEEEELLRELRVAKSLGMDTVIIDDGWQTDDASRGYKYCGDWEVSPKKFPDMKKFADAVHAIGMKLMVWYSVPFVGYLGKNYERFRGKYLCSIDHLKTSVLDPRYPDVRAFLADIYARDVEAFGLDGLKLDFIDRFRLSSQSNSDYENMDFRSVEEAVEQLLRDVYERLTALNPDILLEFRQSYIGPVVTTYGNMLRVGDCPNDPLSNRTGAVDLRMLSNVAVHSDMLMWHRDDTLASVAKQLLCVMFAVPQISVKLAGLPADHLAYLRGFLSFVKEHRNALMRGRISARGVAASYTQVTSENASEAITVCYEDSTVTLLGKTQYIFNGSPREAIYLDASNEQAMLRVRVYDTAWRETDVFTASGEGVIRIPTEAGGYVCVERCEE